MKKNRSQDLRHIASTFVWIFIIFFNTSLFATTNPILDYRLDECSWDGTAGEVKDSSGNGYNIQSYNGANTESNITAEGGICHVGKFDGSNDKIEGDFNASFDNAVTLSVWINTTSKQTSYARVMEFSSHGGDYHYSTAIAYDFYGKTIRAWTTNSLAIRSREVSYNLSTNGFHDGKWHLLTYVYNGAKAKLYIDGNKVDEEDTNITKIDKPDTITIGGYGLNSSYSFKGYLDEAKVFNGALSDSEIQQIYNNEKSGKNYDGSARICSCYKPIVEYHLDECSWSGISGEVKDSSGNNYNGKAINGANTETNTSAGGGICHVGNFKNLKKQHIEIDNFPKIKGSRTITAWIKVKNINNGGRIFADDKKNQSGDYALSYGDPGSGKLRFYIRGLNAVSLDSNSVVTANKWYFVVAKFNASTMQKELVVYNSNGNKLDDVSQSVSGTPQESEGAASIAGERDDGNEKDMAQFNGDIDEVKVFDKALTNAEIESIYNNERSGKNYDGSKRYCPCCLNKNYKTVPLEFEGAHIVLNTSTHSPHWTHVDFNETFSTVPVVFVVSSTRGDHPATVRVKNVTRNGFDAVMSEPQGEDGPHYDQNISFLAVNKGLHKIGHTYFEVGSFDTKKYQQSSSGGVIDENEWKKIKTKFKSCEPVVVANIQTINNEKGLDIPNSNVIIRSIPFLTTAIDVNDSGVYIALERSETHEGDVNKKETIGYMIAPANIQDSVVDDYDKNITFETIRKSNYFVGWDDTCKSVKFVNHYSKIPLIAANKNSKNGVDGGWFRRCFLDKNRVGFQIDEDGSNYSKLIYDYNSEYQDRERHHVPESGGIFVFSDTIVIRENGNPKNFKFDAWDIWRDINDKNISTKIVNQDFNLTIASLDENGTNYQDFNGTVCAKIDNDIVKLDFRDQNSSSAEFKINRALKDIKVEISWKKNVDENCPLTDEDNSTLSTDNFAIRPLKFNIIPPLSQVYAGEDFNLSFNALDDSDGNTTDYNETKEVSFKIEANVTKAGCFNGYLNLGNFSFKNGVAKDINTTYSNLGDINITIKEINGSEFAKVDEDDTNDSNRLIKPKSIILNVKPYEINITDVNYINSTGKEWLYDANVKDMNTTVRATIKAFAKGSSSPLIDFNSTCYAKDMNISFLYDSNYSDSNISLVADQVDGVLHYQDINSSYITLQKSNFIGGEANATYAFNVSRNFKKPISPVFIKLKDINITTLNIAKNENNATVNGLVKDDQNSTFYYGKIYGNDISTTEQSITSNLYIDIFCKNCGDTFNGGFQESFNWYRNVLDDDVIKNNDINLTAHSGFSISSPTKNNITISNMANSSKGKISFDLSNTINSYDSAYIHIKIPPFLWYNRYKEYNDSSSSDCSTHPCIGYKLSIEDTTKSVESGEFSGADIGKEQNRTIKRMGVKVYR